MAGNERLYSEVPAWIIDLVSRAERNLAEEHFKNAATELSLALEGLLDHPHRRYMNSIGLQLRVMRSLVKAMQRAEQPLNLKYDSLPLPVVFENFERGRRALKEGFFAKAELYFALALHELLVFTKQCGFATAGGRAATTLKFEILQHAVIATEKQLQS